MMEIEQIARKYNAEIALIVLLLRIKLGTAKANEIDLFLKGKSPDLDIVLELVRAHELTSIVFSIKEGREILSSPKTSIPQFQKKLTCGEEITCLSWPNWYI